jgi:hypothetical protein
MAVKVAEDVEEKRVQRAELSVYICAQRRRAVQRRELCERIAYREKDAIDLRVLVCAGSESAGGLFRRDAHRRTDEHERVGHVVVAHVDHGRADPATEALLCAIEYRVHHTGRLVCRLYAVQALARVAQTVRDRLGEQVLLGERPEVEHV